MSTTNPDAREVELDRLFTRTLLASARADELPRSATKAAWAKFAGAVALSALPVANHGAGSGRAGKAGARLAAKWLVIGALGGSSLTFAWMRGHPVTTPAAVVRGSNVGAVTAPVAVVRDGNVDAAPPVVEAPPAAREDAVAAPVLPSVHSPRRAVIAQNASLTSRAPSVATPASTLAAEVSALDAARTASSLGNDDEALRLIADYQRSFPAGELRADADVVAIDALAAKGDGTGAARRAAQFLERYPNDPHAAHVSRIARDAPLSGHH